MIYLKERKTEKDKGREEMSTENKILDFQYLKAMQVKVPMIISLVNR
jgi:hypothetical protein